MLINGVAQMERIHLHGVVQPNHAVLYGNGRLIQSSGHTVFYCKGRTVSTVPQLVLFRLVANAQDRTLKDVLRVAGCNVTGRMDAPEGGEDIPDGGRRVQHVGLGLCQCTGVCNALCQSQRDILADLRHDLGRRMGVEGRFAGIDYSVCNLFGSVCRVFLAFELTFCHAFACIFTNACKRLVNTGCKRIAVFQFIQDIGKGLPEAFLNDLCICGNFVARSAPIGRIKRVMLGAPALEFTPQVIQCGFDHLPEIRQQFHNGNDRRCTQSGKCKSNRFRALDDRVAEHLYHCDQCVLNVRRSVDDGGADGACKHGKHADNGHRARQLQRAGCKLVKCRSQHGQPGREHREHASRRQFDHAAGKCVDDPGSL